MNSRKFARRSFFLTEHFAILELQNPSINVSEQHQFRQSTDLSKSTSVSSGSCAETWVLPPQLVANYTLRLVFKEIRQPY